MAKIDNNSVVNRYAACTRFVTLRKEAGDPERPIINIADCEIDGKRDWVRAGTISRVCADQ